MSAHQQSMKGFDAEFVDLPDYIIKITDRIWEQRQIADINRYYTSGCVVETPSGVTNTLDAVIRGTEDTLRAFPDRRLLAEDVLWCGDAERGFYSSHRIISPMTHLGEGAFGAPTGQCIQVRTIADCWCIDNRIAHEWLVRDQAAIARFIGIAPDALAKRWLEKTDGIFKKSTAPSAPAPYAATIESSEFAARTVERLRGVLNGDMPTAIIETSDEAITALTPGEHTRYGKRALEAFWHAYRAAFSFGEVKIEHLFEMNEPNAAPKVAARFRVKATHVGDGHFGRASNQPVEILGITHAEWRNGRVIREWILIDEIAIWMQVLSRPQTIG